VRAQVTAARRRSGGETGAASVEYVGAIVIVAVVILAVIASVLATQPRIRDGAELAICKVFTLGLGDCGGGSDKAIDREPQEPCIVTSDGGETSVSVGVIAFGEGDEIWLIEQLGDGTYRVTEGVGLAGGAEGGAGGKIEVTINDQEYGGEAGLSGLAKIGVTVGNTYYAKNLDEAHSLLDRMRYDRALQGSGLAGKVIDLVDGKDPLPEPDTVWIEAGVDANGSASVEGMGAGVEAAGEIEGAIGTQINKDGSATVYLTGKVSGEVSASIGVSLIPESKGKHAAPRELDFSKVEAGASAGGEIGATVQVDYDDAGQATAVRITSTMGWSAEATAKLLGQGPETSAGTTTDTTLELPLTSDADRAIAADMLATLGIPYVPGLSDVVRPPDVPFSPGAIDAATKFGEAARDRGRVWIDTYEHDDSTKFGLKIEAAFGGKVNLGGSYITNNRTGISQMYFDGTEWVERSGCAA
jgi:hypothetical protein